MFINKYKLKNFEIVNQQIIVCANRINLERPFIINAIKITYLKPKRAYLNLILLKVY